jgi:hypothetical protein
MEQPSFLSLKSLVSKSLDTVKPTVLNDNAYLSESKSDDKPSTDDDVQHHTDKSPHSANVSVTKPSTEDETSTETTTAPAVAECETMLTEGADPPEVANEMSEKYIPKKDKKSWFKKTNKATTAKTDAIEPTSADPTYKYEEDQKNAIGSPVDGELLGAAMVGAGVASAVQVAKESSCSSDELGKEIGVSCFDGADADSSTVSGVASVSEFVVQETMTVTSVANVKEGMSSTVNAASSKSTIAWLCKNKKTKKETLLLAPIDANKMSLNINAIDQQDVGTAASPEASLKPMNKFKSENLIEEKVSQQEKVFENETLKDCNNSILLVGSDLESESSTNWSDIVHILPESTPVKRAEQSERACANRSNCWFKKKPTQVDHNSNMKSQPIQSPSTELTTTCNADEAQCINAQTELKETAADFKAVCSRPNRQDEKSWFKKPLKSYTRDSGLNAGVDSDLTLLAGEDPIIPVREDPIIPMSPVTCIQNGTQLEGIIEGVEVTGHDCSSNEIEDCRGGLSVKKNSEAYVIDDESEGIELVQ